MANKNTITVQSSKKSFISKVEVVSVLANDVTSLTARHPVAVVVSEKLCPTSRSEKEPKRIFIPGCPVPQILGPEVDSEETESRNIDAADHKFYQEPNRVGIHHAKPLAKKLSKTVTFKIENGRGHREYNPKDYEEQSASCLSRDDGETSRLHQNQGGNRPPHFVLLSKGLQPARYVTSESNSDEQSAKTNSSSYGGESWSSSEDTYESSSARTKTQVCDCIPDSSDDISTYENSSPSNDEKTCSSDNELVFKNLECVRNSKRKVNSKYLQCFLPPQSDTDISYRPSDFSQEEHIDPSDVAVRSGSVHIREKPHVLETRRVNSNHKYAAQQKIVNIGANSRPALTTSWSGTRPSSAASERKTIRGKENGSSSLIRKDKMIRHEREGVASLLESKKPSGMVTSPTRHSSAPQNKKNARQNNVGKTQSKLGNVYNRKTVTQPVRGKLTPGQHSPRAPETRPSSITSSQTVPSKVPLKTGASAKIISGNPSGVATSTAMPLYHSKSKDKNNLHSLVYGRTPSGGENLNLEEFAALAKWAATEREEIKKYFTEMSIPPYSRFSQVLKDLGSGAFDEDKYLISRRVDLYIREAYKTAVDSIKKGGNPFSPGPLTGSGISASFTNKLATVGLSGIPESNMTSATSTSIQSVKKDYLHLLHPRPPPLFSHHWITCTQRSSQVPLSENQTGSVWQTRNDHELAFVSVSRMKRSKGRKIASDSSMESYPSQDQQPGSDNRSPEFSTVPSSAHTHEQRKISVNPPSLSEAKKNPHDPIDRKPQLQYSHQKGVDIRTNMVTENVAGISISPRNIPLYQNERRHAVLKVVYGSQTTENLAFGSNQEVPQNNHHDEATALRGRGSPQQEVQNNPHEEPEIFSHNGDDDANSHSAESLETEGNGMKEDDNENYQHEVEIPVIEGINDHPQIDHKYQIPEQNNTSDVAQGSKTLPMQSHHNGSESGYNNERETLPGYLPEIRWEEVTVENCRYEEDNNFSRERLHEAENRLYEQEMRQRILSRLEDRLQHLLEGQEESDLGAVEEDLRSLCQNADDINDQQMSMAVEAVRALLTDLVHQRLPLIISQEVAEPPPAVTDEVYSAVETPGSEASHNSTAKESPNPVCTPEISPRPALENIPSREQIKTPPPSPPPPRVMQDEGLPPNQVLTPQVSLEELDEENEVIATPSTSPPSGRSVILVHPPRTPVITPGGSPAKVKFREISVVTPTESPLSSEEEVEEQAASTPVITPSPRKSLDRGGNIPKTPTPSRSPVNLHPKPVVCINTPVGALSPHEMGVPRLDSPSYADQATQVETEGRENKHMTHSAIQVHSNYGLIEPTSPETLSVICHSSTDATVSSSVEESDTTYMTLSEGEVLSCELPLNTSVEHGEISRSCNLGMPHITEDVCTAHKSVTKGILIKEQDTQDITKSEGEMQLYENSSSDDTRGMMERLTPDNSQSEDTIQHDQLTMSEVSVVQNDSYSSGDATAISSEELEALRRENAILMSRLRNLGSFSFLTGNSRSSSVTHGSST